MSRPWTALATLALFGALALALVVGMAPNLHTVVVSLGERTWPGYAAELRDDPVAPECDVAALDEQLGTCSSSSEGSAADPFDGQDPFADPDRVEADPFAGEDPFADPEPAEADPFADDDPFADADPFADDAAPDGPSCEAVQALRDRCVQRHAEYEDKRSRLNGPVMVFRALERRISDFAHFGGWKHLLSLVLLIGAFNTTLRRHHIALREAESPLEHTVAQGTQLVAHLLWTASCIADWQVQQASSAESEHGGLPLIWAVGFAVLAAINVLHLVRRPKGLDGGGGVARLLMVVPLYAWMALIAGAWFLLGEQHFSGQAIYVHKFVQVPTVYLGIGLYIWAGMMLAETTLAQRTIAVLTPWKLPVMVLAWVLVLGAALPTAYSGASGIFVIAAGAVLFNELRSAGATRRQALMATAMSGSLGVVLRPCLVVVLIAVLNKQVTTDELFGKGLQVFALTAVLSFAAFLWRSREPFSMAPASEALPKSVAAIKRLVPHLLVLAGVLAFFYFALGTVVNEHTAPFVLPVLLLAVVLFDKPGLRWKSLVKATDESSSHVGALLTLMVGSVGLGGVVERAEVMSLVPTEFGSVWITMALLVVVMVLVGMTMDALGAVVLVSVSVAPVAYANGISPVHFWMMVLVAFELGYLTPPVALNHLLARQVIGAEAKVELYAVEGGWFERYEHIVVPMLIMGAALLLVAFVPLMVGG